MRRVKVSAPAGAVWRLVGDFGALPQWMRGVSHIAIEGSGVGAVRRCETAAGLFVERLMEVAPFRCRYEIVSGPLPVRDYRATIEVRPLPDESCELVWSGCFRAAEHVSDESAARAVAAIYEVGLAGLARHFGQGARDATAMP